MKSRFIIMIAAVLTACTGWTFGWRHISGEAEETLAKALESANRSGQRIACADRRTGGFPFRLALECGRSVYAQGSDFAVELAGLQAQAFVYRPLHQVVDFKSPAEIRAGNLGTLQLTWQKARLGSQLQSDGLSAATAKIENARLSLLNPPPELLNTAVTADLVTLSARRSSGGEAPNSIVFGLISNGLAVLGTKYTLPPLAIEASVLAYDIADIFEGRGSPFPLWIEKGGEADIHGISLVSGNAELFMKGWVKLDRDGFLHADLDVDSANLSEFADAMGPELIQFQSAARAIIATIDGFGEDTLLRERKVKRVKVTIRKGFVNIGAIPLAAIPQIDLSGL